MSGSPSVFSVCSVVGNCLIVPKEKIAANGDYNLSGERYREGGSRSSNIRFVRIGDVCDIDFEALEPAAKLYPGSIPELHRHDPVAERLRSKFSERNSVSCRRSTEVGREGHVAKDDDLSRSVRSATNKDIYDSREFQNGNLNGCRCASGQDRATLSGFLFTCFAPSRFDQLIGMMGKDPNRHQSARRQSSSKSPCRRWRSRRRSWRRSRATRKSSTAPAPSSTTTAPTSPSTPTGRWWRSEHLAISSWSPFGGLEKAIW